MLIGNNIAHDTKSRMHDVNISDIALKNNAIRLSFSKTIPAAHPPIYVRIKVEFGS